MTNVFIIHGVGGFPEENWFPWLKEELEQLGAQVFVPQFPTPENQTLSKWIKVLKEYEEFITPRSIFIGHSLGAAFVLNVLEKNPAKAAILVAGFVGKIENSFDENMKTFTQKTFDWEAIKSKCQNFIIFHSDNDPYVKTEKGQELADHLEVVPILVKNAGHFNKAAHYESFHLLLEKIKPFLN